MEEDLDEGQHGFSSRRLRSRGRRSNNSSATKPSEEDEVTVATADNSRSSHSAGYLEYRSKIAGRIFPTKTASLVKKVEDERSVSQANSSAWSSPTHSLESTSHQHQQSPQQELDTVDEKSHEESNSSSHFPSSSNAMASFPSSRSVGSSSSNRSDKNSENDETDSGTISNTDALNLWSKLSERLSRVSSARNVAAGGDSNDASESSSSEYDQEADIANIGNAINSFSAGSVQQQEMAQSQGYHKSHDMDSSVSGSSTRSSVVPPDVESGPSHQRDRAYGSYRSSSSTKNNRGLSHEKRQNDSRSKSRCSGFLKDYVGYIVVVGSLLIMFLVIILVVLLREGESSSSTEEVVTSPTIAPFEKATESPTTSPTVVTDPTLSPVVSAGGATEGPTQSIVDEGEMYLRNLVLDTGITTDDDLNDEISPQSRALAWMVESFSSSFPDWQLVQRYALATFFFATEGDNWNENEGWLTDLPECEWLSPSDCYNGVVIGLSLDSNNLGGTLPKELGILIHLEEIMLDAGTGTRISGKLPQFLASCTRLKLLSLFGHALSGNLSDDLVRSWPDLVRLDLSGNTISGQLPSSLGELGRLRTVFLNSNNFTGRIPISYGSTVAGQLELDGNNLAGPFPNGTLPNMVSLSFAHNQLTSLPETIMAPKLRRLAAHDNELGGGLPGFAAIDTIEEIALSRNKLTGPIPWMSLARIQAIDISSNQLDGVIPSELTLVPSLSVLLVHGNAFTEIACTEEKRPSWFADCGVLEEGSVPEIECSCCSACCIDGGDCQPTR